MSTPIVLAIELTNDQLQVIAERVAVLLDERKGDGRSWFDTAAAAKYLSCPTSRIHDLVAKRKLNPRRDGRKLVFKREDLDAYLEASA